jgi:D-ornithine 4,5-aminomutase subunit alpha
MKRADDFDQRRAHLKDMTDEQLHDRFWELAERIVAPMLDMGFKYTTPAVERSVLLRMGFSSLEVKPIVEGVIKKDLMGKGCGNVVWLLAQKKGVTVREAGLMLAEGREWDTVDTLFAQGEAQV